MYRPNTIGPYQFGEPDGALWSQTVSTFAGNAGTHRIPTLFFEDLVIYEGVRATNFQATGTHTLAIGESLTMGVRIDGKSYLDKPTLVSMSGHLRGKVAGANVHVSAWCGRCANDAGKDGILLNNRISLVCDRAFSDAVYTEGKIDRTMVFGDFALPETETVTSLAFGMTFNNYNAGTVA